MERRTAGRGVGGLYRKHGRVSDGRCDRDVLACTCVAGTQRTSLPDTQNLVEVWVGASRHRISLVVCTVDLLLTPTNAYRVPSIITRLGTSVTRVASRKSGYVRFSEPVENVVECSSESLHHVENPAGEATQELVQLA